MSSFNTDLNSPLSRRMTSIKTDSPSTLKLGDPISEQFKSKQNLSSETSEIKFNGKEYIFYILIFFLLAILGINIFVYLGILSENLISFFRPIIFNFAYYGSEAVKTTVDSAAEGSKLGIDVAAGTVDYTNGVIKINSVLISSVSNVDGSVSTQFRITVLPDSNDVIPVRNQLLEIDTVNTSVVGNVDATATTGKGYTVTTTGGAGSTTGTATTTTTTVATTSSTPTSSSY